MELVEKRINLFNVDKEYYLVHCISADAGINNKAMGMGIAVEFQKIFHIKQDSKIKDNHIS